MSYRCSESTSSTCFAVSCYHTCDLILLTDHLASTCVSAHHIKQWTSQDPVLSCVHCFIQTGWPVGDLEQQFHPYNSKWSELSVFDGCIL